MIEGQRGVCGVGGDADRMLVESLGRGGGGGSVVSKVTGGRGGEEHVRAGAASTKKKGGRQDYFGSDQRGVGNRRGGGEGTGKTQEKKLIGGNTKRSEFCGSSAGNVSWGGTAEKVSGKKNGRRNVEEYGKGRLRAWFNRSKIF